MVNKLSINHLYIGYFKLIYQRLNITVLKTTEIILEPLPVTINKISYYGDSDSELIIKGPVK